MKQNYTNQKIFLGQSKNFVRQAYIFVFVVFVVETVLVILGTDCLK